MTRTDSPQGKEEEDSKWPIDFNRQSLLTACWGSAKGADFLYHFLNKARWEIKNQKLAKSVKVIKFQEEKTDILNALKKADRFISQGMYSTMLRNFNAVGYVISQPYGTSYEVHLDVIENAFKQPPQKPEPKNKQEKSSHKVSKMTDRHNDTISRTEYNSLVEVCIKLTDKCQSLTESVALLTSMCQSLTLQKSSSSTPQDALPSTIWLQSNALEIEDDSENLAFATISGDQHICGCANATPHLRLLEEIDPLAEDMPEAQPQQKVTAEQANIAYSQDIPSTTQETLFGDDAAYRKNEDKPPSEEKKPKQPKVALTPDQLEQCRRWWTHFEKVHGEPFEGKGVKQNVGKYIKMLVLKYDETTIMRIYKHLSEKDFKWSKPSFKYKITPYVVYDNAPSVLQQLSNPEPSHQQSGKSRVSPTGHTSTEEEMQEIERRSEEQEAYLRAMAAAKRAVAN